MGQVVNFGKKKSRKLLFKKKFGSRKMCGNESKNIKFGDKNLNIKDKKSKQKHLRKF